MSDVYKYSLKPLNGVLNCGDLRYRINLGAKPQKPVYGRYLTTLKNFNSRYAEDVLAITYSPKHMDRVVTPESNVSYLEFDQHLIKRRIFPAFGQIGGAHELLAICSDPSHTTAGKTGLRHKLFGTVQDGEFLTGGRKQPFANDLIIPFSLSTVLSQIIANFDNVMEFDIKVIGSNVEGNFPENLSGSIVIFFKYDSELFTISMAIRDSGGSTYISVLGSMWRDVQENGKFVRYLWVTDHEIAVVGNGVFPNSRNAQGIPTISFKSLLDALDRCTQELIGFLGQPLTKCNRSIDLL